MYELRFQFPGGDTKENVVEANDLCILHSNIESLGAHHRQKERTCRNVRRKKSIRIFVEGNVPLAVLNAKWHCVIPDVANYNIAKFSRFDSLEHRNSVFYIDKVVIIEEGEETRIDTVLDGPLETHHELECVVEIRVFKKLLHDVAEILHTHTRSRLLN